MNFLRWWTAAVALLGVTMTLCLSVVTLMYFIYIDSLPEMRDELPLLLKVVGLFAVLATLGVSAAYAMWRNKRWLWPTQVMLLIGAVGIGLTFWFGLKT